MSLGKELLLSCIVIMHISFMISQPVKHHKNHVLAMKLSLHNLVMAEKDYINYMFGDDGLKNVELLPLEGITRPVGNNTEENQTSMCAIISYLDNQVPAIINSLLGEPNEDLITNISAFNTQLKALSQNNTCTLKSNYTTCDDYSKKVAGYRMIHFARDWVEQYFNTTAASF